MAYDSQRQRTVLFGGNASGFATCDTWEWDGSSWTQVSTTGPPPRSAHAMVYDLQRDSMLLFGGHSVAVGNLDDTWEWDGNSWTELVGIAPSARRYHAMIYDSQRWRTILFGGGSDGETWERVNPSIADSFGTGCGSPALALSPVTGARPSIGTTAQAFLTNTPSPLAFVGLGSSRTTYGAFSLPLSQAPYGKPGCTLLQSKTWWQPLGLGNSMFSLPLPNQPTLLGTSLYLQGWTIAPGVNPGNTVTSNGLEWVIGNS